MTKYSDKQVQIIEVAETLFAEHGFGNTSVRQIADEAGVNLAMINYYFGSKENLIHALVEIRTSHMGSVLENLVKDDTLTPPQKLNIMVTEHVQRFVQRQSFYKIMVREHVLDKNNSITKMLIGIKRKNAEILSQIILEGQKKKLFKKNIDVVMLMNILVGTVNHSLLNREFYREFHQLKKMKDEEFNTYLIKKVTEEIKTIFKALLEYEA